MAPQNAKSLMKDFRASFRRKKTPSDKPKIDKAKEMEAVELAKLAELKENLGENVPKSYSDAALLSFLRARSLNVKEAEKLMKLDVNMRQFLQVDQLMKEYVPKEVVRKYGLAGIIGFDKEGSLIRVINAGVGDFKGYVHSISTIEMLKLFIHNLESDLQLQEAENKKTGRKNHQFVYILNFEHVSMSQFMYKPALDTGILALKLLQDHYHDVTKVIYIVNAPSFFSSAFKLVKPAIQDSLQEKLRIFDSDNWKENLLKHIEADLLPVYLGGNRVDSNNDAMCREFIDFGGPVPESYYFEEFMDPDDPDVITATVPAGSFLNIRYPVTVENTIIRWHIQAKDNDIGIGVFMEPLTKGLEEPEIQLKKKKDDDMSQMEQLTPVIRSQCHICPEIGIGMVRTFGNIVLHFDNSYSWMNSKEVQFKISLEPPSKMEMMSSNAIRNATKSLQKMAISK